MKDVKIKRMLIRAAMITLMALALAAGSEGAMGAGGRTGRVCFAASIIYDEETALPDYIFSDKWNKEYDVLYHFPGVKYTYRGSEVSFPDADHVAAAGQTYDIRNRLTEAHAEDYPEDGMTTVWFTNVYSPLEHIDKTWEIKNGGGSYIVYDIPELGGSYNTPIKSIMVVPTVREMKEQMRLSGLAYGTYHMTGGYIREFSALSGLSGAASGMDFGDGAGVVRDRHFGYMPDFAFTVGEDSDEAVKTMEEGISALPDPDKLEYKHIRQVRNARRQYGMLSSSQQASVSNYGRLEAAEASVDKLLAARYKDGTYTADSRGLTEMTLSLTINGGKISDIEILKCYESKYYWELAKKLPDRIIADQTPDVDGISGASLSSWGIKHGVEAALAQAEIKPPAPDPKPTVTKPAKVKGLKAKVGKRSAKLTWKKVSGAKGYKVYYSLKKSSGFKSAGTVKPPKKTVKKLKKGKKYYFKVRAYKLSGKKYVYGSYSATVKSGKIK